MNNMLLSVYVKLQNLFNREEGQDLVEYALLISLLALAAISILGSLGGTISKIFSNVNTSLT